jgi:hypothetical protein
VKLYKLGGEVYIEVLSESPVFVQSQITNMSLGAPLHTVSKVPPGIICSML